MRQQKPSLRNSFFAWLGVAEAEATEVDIETVRSAMVELLRVHGDERYTRLAYSVLHTTSLETLWYARPTMMQMISAHRDERFAREAIDRITKLFKNYRPGGASPVRASPSRFSDL